MLILVALVFANEWNRWLISHRPWPWHYNIPEPCQWPRAKRQVMNEGIDGLRRELCSGAWSCARVVRNTASAMNKGIFKLFTFSLSCNYTLVVLHVSVFLILLCYFYSRPPLIKLQDSTERVIGFLSKLLGYRCYFWGGKTRNREKN